MKNKDEKEYYIYLEKVIRTQKAKLPFFQKESEDYEMDILMLVNHIIKRNPHLAEKIIGNFIDTTNLQDASKADILRFMNTTEKGTIVKWKNEEGEELYLVNNGTNLFKQSKRILVFGNHLNKGDIQLLKNSIYGSILKKDIQHIYEKVRQDEIRRQKRIQAGKSEKSLFDKWEEKREQKIEHTSSNFEKNFKELIKQQGSIASPFATAQTMISLMSNSEKKKLSQSLTARGVKNEHDLESLLSKWKNEALHPEYKIERTYKKTITTKTIKVGR